MRLPVAPEALHSANSSEMTRPTPRPVFFAVARSSI
jgi:hypothetical protein